MKLLLIGPINGPKGGVNIHMNRLKMLLKNDFDINIIDESSETNTDNFNIRSKNLFKYLQIMRTSKIVYIHSNQWWLRVFHIIWAKLLFKKIVVTIHSYNFWAPKYQTVITNYFLSLVDKVIFVSPEISKIFKIKQAIVQPAFLPPQFDLEPALPNEVLESLAKGYKIVVANAWQLFQLKNGELYGFDLCIELAKIFKKQGKKIKIIFVVTTNNDLLERYKKNILDYGIEKNFTLIEKSISFVKLIEKSDLVLRPTGKDGDAITIREALFLNKPIVASDIVNRPEGTLIYKNRNVDDLYDKVLYSLSQTQDDFKIVDAIDYLLFYKNIILNLNKKENK